MRASGSFPHTYGKSLPFEKVAAEKQFSHSFCHHRYAARGFCGQGKYFRECAADGGKGAAQGIAVSHSVTRGIQFESRPRERHGKNEQDENEQKRDFFQAKRDDNCCKQDARVQYFEKIAQNDAAIKRVYRP